MKINSHQKQEKLQRKNFHRYLVTNSNVPRGEKLKLEYLNFMRVPKTKNSILAFEYKKYLNKKLRNNLAAYQILKKKDFFKYEYTNDLRKWRYYH